MPCSASSLAVPPVDRILILNRASPRANSASPVLSDTLTSGDRLVACGSIQDNFEHRPLDVLDHHVVDGARLCPVEVLEVPLQRPADAIRDLVCLPHTAVSPDSDSSLWLSQAALAPIHAASSTS